MRRRVQPGHEDRTIVDVVHSGEHCLVSVLYGEPVRASAGVRILGPGGGVKRVLLRCMGERGRTRRAFPWSAAC